MIRHGIAAGLHVVAVFPRTYDERKSSQRRELAVYGLAGHRVGRGGKPALLLGYAAATEPSIRAAALELARAVRAASA